MAKQTAIQWTDATVNFWRGCKKVSLGSYVLFNIINWDYQIGMAVIWIPGLNDLTT
jgi:hypothetical protein